MSSLRPVSGSAVEILALLRSWDEEAGEPDPLVVQTSGSSGTPKRVRLSRAAMRASARATQERLGGPGQWLLNLPPTHVAGLQVLFRSARAGTTPVLDDGDLAAAAEAMTGERRYVSLVPTQLHRLLDDDVAVAALRSFRTVLVGGAAVPQELRDRAAGTGVRTVATYGMSETCGGCVYDGVPLDGVSVRLDRDDRVMLAGPVLFDGYDDPGLTAEVLVDGWLRTQDLGSLDDAGRLRVLGRADDMVVSGGVKVPAPAVAARLSEHPGVRDAVVVGVPDREWGERVVAVVVGEISRDAARDWVADALPRTWAPREVRCVASIPLLHNGKVDRVRLRELVR